MDKILSISWTRIFAEGTAIVFSILLAFWIQAWWEDRQHQQEERAILTSLMNEFLDKKERLNRDRLINRSIHETTRHLIEVALNPDAGIDEDEMNRALADIWWFFDETDWEMAVLEGLIASGDISRLSNSELRRNLGQWPIRVGRVRLYYRMDLEYYERRMEPYLNSNAFLPAIANQETHVPGFPDETLYSNKYQYNGPSTNAALLTDVEFQNLLVHKSYKNENILSVAYDGLDAAFATTIAMLEAELTN